MLNHRTSTGLHAARTAHTRIAEPQDPYQTHGEPGRDTLLGPADHAWARERLHIAVRSQWNPLDTDLSEDVRSWQDPHALSRDERGIFQRSLAFFLVAETLIADNLVLAIYRHIGNRDCRQYLLRQAFDNSLHQLAYRHIVEALGLDPETLASLQREVPAIERKIAWARPFTRHLADPQFRTGTPGNDQLMLRELIAFYVVFGGIMVHAGFSQILSMGRRAKMRGTARLLEHILRNQMQHAAFGVDLINQVKLENPQLWGDTFKQSARHMIEEAVDIATQYAYDSMPRGILGLNAPMFEEYLRFTANYRCAQIGLASPYRGASNPFPWINELASQPDEPPPDSHGPTTRRRLRWD